MRVGGLDSHRGAFAFSAVCPSFCQLIVCVRCQQLFVGCPPGVLLCVVSVCGWLVAAQQDCMCEQLMVVVQHADCWVARHHRAIAGMHPPLPAVDVIG